MRVIDFHDDLGELYLSHLGDNEPPAFLKTASWVESYDLLDRDFALIIVDEQGHEHRKYASHDGGNTAMSIFYLLNAEHGLSAPAVKVAAFNLLASLNGSDRHSKEAQYLLQLSEMDLGDLEGRVMDERRVLVLEKDAGLGDLLMRGARGTRAMYGGAAKTVGNVVGHAGLASHGSGQILAAGQGALAHGHRLAATGNINAAGHLTQGIKHTSAVAQDAVATHNALKAQTQAVSRQLAAPGVTAETRDALRLKHRELVEQGSSNVTKGRALVGQVNAAKADLGAVNAMHGKPPAPATNAGAAPFPPAAPAIDPASPYGKYHARATAQGKTPMTPEAHAAAMQRQMALRTGQQQAGAQTAPGTPPAEGGGNGWMYGAGALGVAGIGGGYMLGKAQQQQPMTVQASASVFDLLKVADMKWFDLDPYDKHEIAVHLCKVASEEGATIPPHIFQYGGTTLNPHFERLMGARLGYVRDPEIAEDYDRLGKIAGVMNPEEVVEALFMLDDSAGLVQRYGTRLPDPLLCVYGQEKQAGWAWSSGSDYINEDLLTNFAASQLSKARIIGLFSDELALKFRKAPVATFKGLPLEQQRILSRMALQATSERL